MQWILARASSHATGSPSGLVASPTRFECWMPLTRLLARLMILCDRSIPINQSINKAHMKLQPPVDSPRSPPTPVLAPLGCVVSPEIGLAQLMEPPMMPPPCMILLSQKTIAPASSRVCTSAADLDAGCPTYLLNPRLCPLFRRMRGFHLVWLLYDL
jgi:hypothetical protein